MEKEIETKTIRSHEINEDGTLKLIRTQIGINGSGNKVSVTSIEDGVSPDVVDKVLNESVRKEIERLDKEERGVKEKKKKLNKEVKKFDIEELDKFAEFLKDPETKRKFEQLNVLRDFRTCDKQLENIKKERKDVLDWKAQFLRIKEDLKKK
jgi:septal ring factor EnvC (AmiA/AmiB activator)